jgi:hypothetical protein
MTSKQFTRNVSRFWYDWTINHTTGATSSKNQHGRSFSWTNSIDSSAKLPNWRRLIAQGACATTLLGVSTNEVVAEPSYFLYKKRQLATNEETSSISAGDYHDVGLYPLGFTFNSNVAINRSLVKLYEDLASQETYFKGLVFSGELKESLSMIRHPARALRRGVSAYLSRLRSRGPRLPYAKRLSFVRDTWLEYSFGWRPLVADIDNAMTAIQKNGALKPMFRMCRGSFRSDELMQRTTFDYNPTTSLRLQGFINDTELCVAKHYGVYHSQSPTTSVAHRYGFSFSEFLPTLWELMPYSFLVDYFTNIGGILEALSYRNLGIGFVSQTLYRQGLRELVDMRVVVQDPPPGYKMVYWKASPGSYAAKQVQIQRTPNVGLQIPGLTLKVPGNWSQWTNIAALSKQLEFTRLSLNRR